VVIDHFLLLENGGSPARADHAEKWRKTVNQAAFGGWATKVEIDELLNLLEKSAEDKVLE